MGMMSLWSAGTHIQNGRTYYTMGNLARLGVPGPDTLAKIQQVTDLPGFEYLSPASEAWRDEARIYLDRIVLEAMGAKCTPQATLASMRARWCLEPTVQGARGARGENIDQIRRAARNAPLANIARAARHLLRPCARG